MALTCVALVGCGARTGLLLEDEDGHGDGGVHARRYGITLLHAGDQSGAGALLETGDGGLIVLGRSSTYPDPTVMWLADLDGDLNITRTSAFEHMGLAGLASLSELADGSLVIASSTYSASFGTRDILLTRLELSGAVLWHRALQGRHRERSGTVVATPDGGMLAVVATESEGWPYTDDDLWVLHIDEDGGVRWQWTMGGAGGDTPVDLAPVDGGGVYILGYTESFSAGYDVWILRLDALGELLWQGVVGGEGSDQGRAVVAHPDGGVVMAGTTRSFGAGQRDVLVVRLDGGGELLWQRSWGGASNDEPRDLALTADGGVVVVGQTTSHGGEESGEWDAFFARLDADGAMLWHRVLGGDRSDSSGAVEVSADGAIIATGTTRSFATEGSDGYVIVMTPDGHAPGCDLLRSPDPQMIEPGAVVTTTSASPTPEAFVPQDVSLPPLDHTVSTTSLCGS